ncbi:MAG: hypothetical protein ACYDBQ_03265 [Thermoplasmatota archaeon]
MSRDDDDSHALLYIGLGALAAVGAGYLTWRYLLSDDTKRKAGKMAKRAIAKTNDAATDAMEMGRDLAKGVVTRIR